jgi:NADH-quinone oxidoreductase subunit F
MERVITRNFDVADIARLKVARQHGAYLGLAKARRMKPGDAIQEIAASGLRGRDGAGFSVGKKLSLVPEGVDAVIIANVDESDPGTFKDRAILERDPHLVLEGLLIAAHAIGARTAYAYFRAEYAQPLLLLSHAVEEARAAGLVGAGGAVDDVIAYRGGGAYICGEESALINSISGTCGKPSIKPPSPVEQGLAGHPTVVSNVETLAALPFIMREGAKAYRALGTEASSGTKFVSVSGCVRRPGVYEVEMGMPVAAFLKDEAGGFEEGKVFKAFIPGGISTAVLTASEALSCTIDFESFSDVGSALGSGGMVVIDEGVSMVAALADIARFFANESCGLCTPCREGSGWIAKTLARIERGGGRFSDLNLVCDLAEAMGDNALCALAGSMAMPVLSFIAKYRREFEEAIRLGGVGAR